MLKKEEVYVVLDNHKHCEKLNKIVNMFNVRCTVDLYGDGGIAVFDESLFSGTQTKTKVSLKELRNILSRECLKEGDVVLTKNGNDKIIAVVNKTCNSNVALFEAKRWIRLHDGFKWDNKGCFDDFIRYATEEENQMLIPEKSVIDKAISLLNHGLGLDYSHEVIQGLEELKNK